VTRQGAKQLLDDLLANPKTFDHSLAESTWEPTITAYKTQPPIFVQLPDQFGSANLERKVQVQTLFCLHEVSFEQGFVDLARGDLIAAHNSFEKAVTYQPDFGPAKVNLGVVLALLTGGEVTGPAANEGTPSWHFEEALRLSISERTVLKAVIKHNKESFSNIGVGDPHVDPLYHIGMLLQLIALDCTGFRCQSTVRSAAEALPERGPKGYPGKVGYFLGVRYPNSDDDEF
jgi:hypothetical protein